MYTPDFFAERDKHTRYAAEKVLGVVARVLPPITSAVDVGCGVGTWLSVLAAAGATSVLGIDGPWVPRDRLVVPRESFLEADLNGDFAPARRFDLAISLEVAEHLRPESADRFVRNLTSMADVVLFSAAVPYQGGNQHLNEQWPDYWAAKFAATGYIPLDVVRKRLYDDDKIPVWYRQNSLLYVREASIASLGLVEVVENHIAPERYLLFYSRLTAPGVRQSAGALVRAATRRLT